MEGNKGMNPSYASYDDPPRDPFREVIEEQVDDMNDIQVIQGLHAFPKSYEMLMEIARAQLFECLYWRGME